MVVYTQCWWCGGTKAVHESEQRGVSTPARVTQLEDEVSQVRRSLISQGEKLEGEMTVVRGALIKHSEWLAEIRQTAGEAREQLRLLQQLGERILREEAKS